MIYRLYNSKQNRYATPEESVELFLSDQGELLQYYDMREMMDLPEKDWKIQYGFKHSNGKCYYQNDIFEDQHSAYVIGFNGYSFYYTAESKSTFYDVNYGGQRHHVERYNIQSNTKLW